MTWLCTLGFQSVNIHPQKGNSVWIIQKNIKTPLYHLQEWQYLHNFYTAANCGPFSHWAQHVTYVIQYIIESKAIICANSGSPLNSLQGGQILTFSNCLWLMEYRSHVMCVRIPTIFLLHTLQEAAYTNTPRDNECSHRYTVPLFTDINTDTHTDNQPAIMQSLSLINYACSRGGVQPWKTKALRNTYMEF